MERYVEKINSFSEKERVEGMNSIGEWLCEDEVDLQALVSRGILPKFVEFIKGDCDEQLQIATLKAVINFEGTPEHTKCLVSLGIIPELMNLVSSQDKDVRNNAIRALINLSADEDHEVVFSITKMFLESFETLQTIVYAAERDFTAMHKIMMILDNCFRILEIDGNLEKDHEIFLYLTSDEYEYCRKNICDMFSYYFIISEAFPSYMREEILKSTIGAVFYYSCLGHVHCSDLINHKPNFYLEEGGVISAANRKLTILKGLHKFTEERDKKIQLTAVKTIGNFLAETEKETQAVVENGGIAVLRAMMQSDRDEVKKSACWSLSNILAECKDHSFYDKIMKEEKMIFDNARDILLHDGRTKKGKKKSITIDSVGSRMEALYIFSNAFENLKYEEEFKFFVDGNYIEGVCAALNTAELFELAVQSLEIIMQKGQDKLEKRNNASQEKEKEKEQIGVLQESIIENSISDLEKPNDLSVSIVSAIEAIYSDSLHSIIDGMTDFENDLINESMKEKSVIMAKIFDHGLVEKLIDLLADKRQSSLASSIKLKSLSLIQKIISKKRSSLKVFINSPLVENIIQLLKKSSNSDILEQATSLLCELTKYDGMVTNDNDDFVSRKISFVKSMIENDVITPIKRISCGTKPNVKISRNICLLLGKIIKITKNTDNKILEDVAPIIISFISHCDYQVLGNICLAISIFSGKGRKEVNILSRENIVQRLLELLTHPNPIVIEFSIKILQHTITVSENSLTNEEKNIVVSSFNRFLGSDSKGIKIEACNLGTTLTIAKKKKTDTGEKKTADAENQENHLTMTSQLFKNQNSIQKLVEIISCGQASLVKAALSLLKNLCLNGNEQQIKILVEKTCIPPLCDLLSSDDPKVSGMALCSLQNILSKQPKTESENDDGEYEKLVEKAGGYEKIGGFKLLKAIKTKKLPPFVEKIRSDDISAKLEGVRAINKMMLDENREKVIVQIFEFKLLQDFCACFKQSENKSLKFEAFSLLCQVLIDDNGKRASEEDFIAEVVSMISQISNRLNDSEKVEDIDMNALEQSCLVLQSLTMQNSNANEAWPKISVVVPLVLKLIENAGITLRLLRIATSILGNVFKLCAHDDNLRGSCMNPAISRLCMMIFREDTEILFNVVQGINNFCVSYPEDMNILTERRIHKTMIELFQSSSQSIKFSALQVINRLAASFQAVRDDVMASKMLEDFSEILDDENETIRCSACELIATLSSQPINAKSEKKEERPTFSFNFNTTQNSDSAFDFSIFQYPKRDDAKPKLYEFTNLTEINRKICCETFISKVSQDGNIETAKHARKVIKNLASSGAKEIIDHIVQHLDEIIPKKAVLPFCELLKFETVEDKNAHEKLTEKKYEKMEEFLKSATKMVENDERTTEQAEKQAAKDKGQKYKPKKETKQSYFSCYEHDSIEELIEEFQDLVKIEREKKAAKDREEQKEKNDYWGGDDDDDDGDGDDDDEEEGEEFTDEEEYEEGAYGGGYWGGDGGDGGDDDDDDDDEEEEEEYETDSDN